MKKLKLVSVLVLGTLVACATQEASKKNPSTMGATTSAGAGAKGSTANAVFQALGDSGVSGTLTFTQVAGGVRVEGTIAGLAPGSVHGFHVHEKGDCSSPDGKSAGGHFNPDGVDHGDLNASPSHVGDLGNVVADGSGKAMVSLVRGDATLGDGGPHDILGRGLILHADRDDFSQPTGNAGSRVACAVIDRLH